MIRTHEAGARRKMRLEILDFEQMCHCFSLPQIERARDCFNLSLSIQHFGNALRTAYCLLPAVFFGSFSSRIAVL